MEHNFSKLQSEEMQPGEVKCIIPVKYHGKHMDFAVNQTWFQIMTDSPVISGRYSTPLSLRFSSMKWLE